MNTEVVMLATLHQYHREVPFYSVDHLLRLVKVIDPDITHSFTQDNVFLVAGQSIMRVDA